MTANTNLTRHDFSATTRAMVAKALELDLIDGLTLLEMGHEGMDDAAVRYELINIAYANRHVDNTAHRELVKIFDAGAAAEVAR